MENNHISFTSFLTKIDNALDLFMDFTNDTPSKIALARRIETFGRIRAENLEKSDTHQEKQRIDDNMKNGCLTESASPDAKNLIHDFENENL